MGNIDSDIAINCKKAIMNYCNLTENVENVTLKNIATKRSTTSPKTTIDFLHIAYTVQKDGFENLNTRNIDLVRKVNKRAKVGSARAKSEIAITNIVNAGS